ncbi:peptidase [Bifidobacterium breve]|nr:peptidase [Bifidobacterium breve]
MAGPKHPRIPEPEGIHRTRTRPLRNCPTHRCQSIVARRFRHGNNAAGRHSGMMQPVDAEDADTDAVETAEPVPSGQSAV